MEKRYIARGMMMVAALLASSVVMAADNQNHGAMNQKSNSAMDVTANKRDAVTNVPSATSSSTAQSGKNESGAQSSGASGNMGQSSSSASAGQQNGASTIYLIVPVETFTVSDAMKNGCWARIYGDKNFAGDQLTLSGPFSLPKMVGPFGFNWRDKVHSIEVGKSATVTVYDNENFKDQVSQFKPGAKVADVSKRMGFFDNFSSMRIDCSR